MPMGGSTLNGATPLAGPNLFGRGPIPQLHKMLLSGVIPAPHLTSSQASTWVKTPQVGHVPLTI